MSGREAFQSRERAEGRRCSDETGLGEGREEGWSALGRAETAKEAADWSYLPSHA